MRYLQAVAFLGCSIFLMLACTQAQSDCSRNPNLECFVAKGLGGGGTGGATGGGGTGGMPECMTGDDCMGTPPACKENTCIGGKCGVGNLADGTMCGATGALTCQGGMCAGCTSPADCGTPIACHSVECVSQVCMETPDGALTCGPDGMGSCSEAGECGLCDDGVQNGDETGVDCGAGTSCGLCPGTPCTLSTQCATGACADGVCCDKACDGKCEACLDTLTGSPSGTCAPVMVGADDPTTPDCAGKGGCGAVTGFCQCEDGEKNGTETDVDCGGSCGGTCTQGQACTAKEDCKSQFDECVDGVCCNSTCDSECQSCNQAGLEGLCISFSGADPGDMNFCASNKQCNAELGCKKPIGDGCGNNNIDCGSGLCTGSPSKCVACDMANPCPLNKICVNGTCLSKDVPNGSYCADKTMCASGFCMDGVCCNTACDGLCMACHNNYTGQPNGTCAPLLAGYDPHDECTGPGKAATCSGQPDPMDLTKSTCGTN